MGTNGRPTSSHYPVDSWGVDHLRLTAFPASEIPPHRVREWWQDLVGREPSNVNEEPGKGFIQVQGESRESLIHIFSDKSRLDIRMVFSKPGRPASSMPVFDAAISSFHDLAARFLSRNDLPQINRLAFGAALLKSAPRLQDCGEIIKEHLPFSDDYDIEPVDFLYQFNRRRLSRTITGMNVNRLIKWSIQQVELVTVLAQVRVPVRTTTSFAVRLELDINSALEHGNLLQRQRTRPLFEEFVGHAVQIIGVGGSR